MDALVITHTFLFLGCGLSDPDVQLMLERHAQVFPEGRPHYMVISKNVAHEDVRRCFQMNSNLEFITYRPDDNHKELRESVRELVGLVDGARAELVATRDW